MEDIQDFEEEMLDEEGPVDGEGMEVDEDLAE